MRSVELLGLNVQSGGFDQYKLPTDEQPPKRERALSEFFDDQRADGVSAVALTDTFGWDKHYGSSEQIAEHLGFRWAAHQPLNADRLTKLYGETQVGVTFATNHDVDERESKVIRLEDRDALKTVLKLGEKTLHVFTLYLEDLNDDARKQEVRALFSQGVIDPGERTVLVGDLNSPSPRLETAAWKDWGNDLGFRALSFTLGFVPDKHSLEKVLGVIGKADKAATVDYYKLALRGMNRRSATRSLEEHGFTDADQTHLPTIHHGPLSLQLDHIMHKNPADKPLSVRNFQTIPAPSDHKAIRATIEL